MRTNHLQTAKPDPNGIHIWYSLYLLYKNVIRAPE